MSKNVVLMRRFDGDNSRWSSGQIKFQRINGFFYGYTMSCPGCGEIVYLDLNNREDWVIGDIEDVERLTLKKCVWHDISSCGWQGSIKDGTAKENNEKT